MREAFVEKIQNRCWICGKYIPDDKIKITHEAQIKLYGERKNCYFVCISCANAIELYMQHMRKFCIKFGGNKNA